MAMTWSGKMSPSHRRANPAADKDLSTLKTALDVARAEHEIALAKVRRELPHPSDHSFKILEQAETALRLAQSRYEQMIR